MANRQEEKRLRREERLATEQAANASAARRRRVQMAVGAGLALVAAAAVAVAVLGGGGSSGSRSHTASGPAVPIPATKLTDLKRAAAAAGCQLHDYPNYGQTHVTTPVTYKTNPPTSGNHNPVPAPDGIYDPGKEPAKENDVHSLEHGRVEIQYRPGTSPAQIAQLTTLFNEPLKGQAGYKQLLFENNTKMPYAVAATAWTHLLACPTFSPRIFDAIRAFRAKYVEQGPEQIPFPE